jgi:integrase
MATPRNVGTDKNGPWTIQLQGMDGKRATIGLGRMRERDALTTANKIEDLRTARKSGRAPAAEIQTWLDGLPDKMHRALIRAGLVEPRTAPPPAPEVVTLGRFMDQYITRREAELKPGTITLLKDTRKRLVAQLGEDRPIDSIKPQEAEEWRAALLKSGVSESFARLQARIAKSIFNNAVKNEILARSPFRNLPSASKAADREHYVTLEDAAKVIDELPTAELRLVLALARYAGLRIPSESRGLRWGDIDFAGGRMTVYAPKAHRYGKTSDDATRVPPISPELAPLLHAALEAAPDGAEFVAPLLSGGSIAREVKLAIRRAGLMVWPKLMQTLRQSAVTDWRREFPSYIVAEWLGHTAIVEGKHYGLITDEHYAKASNPRGENAAKKLHSADTTGRKGEHNNPTGDPVSPDTLCEVGAPRAYESAALPLSYDPEQSPNSTRPPAPAAAPPDPPPSPPARSGTHR